MRAIEDARRSAGFVQVHTRPATVRPVFGAQWHSEADALPLKNGQSATAVLSAWMMQLDRLQHGQ
jgi:hypothetical protein